MVLPLPRFFSHSLPLQQHAKMSQQSKLGPLESFVLGGASAIVFRSAFAPLERVKLLRQCQGEIVKQGRIAEPYDGAIDCIVRTYRNEGTFEGGEGRGKRGKCSELYMDCMCSICCFLPSPLFPPPSVHLSLRAFTSVMCVHIPPSLPFSLLFLSHSSLPPPSLFFSLPLLPPSLTSSPLSPNRHPCILERQLNPLPLLFPLARSQLCPQGEDEGHFQEQ